MPDCLRVMTAPATLPYPENVAIRVAGRLGMTFFLNLLRIFGDERDLLNAVILLAIEVANLEHLDRSPAGRDAFAGYGRPLEPGLIRPITTHALAASLGQPHETVRRRAHALRSAGACAATEQGLVIPVAELMSPRAQANVVAANQQVRALYLALRDLGLIRASLALDRPFMRPRAVARLAAIYVLRQLASTNAHFADPTISVLLIHVIRATTEHLDDTFTEVSQTDDLVADHLRRPVSVALLSDRSGIPRETTRRHIAQLYARGWVARKPEGGYYLTREMLRQAPWPAARRENVVNLNWMFDGIAAVEAAQES